jgi:hypothetical protein
MTKTLCYYLACLLFPSIFLFSPLRDKQPSVKDVDPHSEIKYRVVKHPSKKLSYELVFQNAPAFIHSLPSAPPTMERELKTGTWLLLVCGVASVPDMACIDVSLRQDPTGSATLLPVLGDHGLVSRLRR